MLDFKIRRGPSEMMFSSPGVINPRFVIEEGCWYLCTDTAELFLGIKAANQTLSLKRINEVKAEVTDENIQAALEALRSEIQELEDLELFQKINSESELPIDFDAEDFNPNVTYYIPLTDDRVSTYIFDRDSLSYVCTNSIDELIVRAMVEPTIDVILEERIPIAIKNTMENTILYGGDATLAVSK